MHFGFEGMSELGYCHEIKQLHVAIATLHENLFCYHLVITLTVGCCQCSEHSIGLVPIVFVCLLYAILNPVFLGKVCELELGNW